MAEKFYVVSHGTTAKEAFDSAWAEAMAESWEECAGTIAEKTAYMVIGELDELSAFKEMEALFQKNDERISEVWGPAGCFKILGENNKWLFFGWAKN